MVKKKNKEIKEKIKENIPEDVRIMYGKFYLFSIIYIIFFSVLYPFVFFSYVSNFSLIAIMIIMALFYGYIICDVIRKKKGFKSYLFAFFIICVILSMSFSILKFFI